MGDELQQRPTGEPRWRPISALDRRVVGVLVEKAKTTPDQYPMSISALRSGVNQKSNRFPMMERELEDIEEALQRLKAVGAVVEVQGGGRIARYRHTMYEWLGVDKVELAVMAELLLRGAQTEGELRGRAARMEPIADVAALRPVLTSLKTKGLLISLTPDGRGHTVTHALYEPRELEKVRAEAQSGAAQYASDPDDQPRAARPSAATTTTAHVHVPQADVAQLCQELDEVRNEVAKLRKEMEDLWSNFR